MTIIFVLTIMISSITAVLIWENNRKAETIIREKKKTVNRSTILYSISSLDSAIAKLEKEKETQEFFAEQKDSYSSLAMTGDILYLFKKHMMTISGYSLEGETAEKELVVTAEGNVENILKLIYDLSFNKEGFYISFISVDTGAAEKPVSLVLRIAYE